MTYFQLSDNTVLCNYACIDRIDWLADFLGERGRWTQAVFSEAYKSAKTWPALNSLLDCRLLGEPIEVEDNESVDLIRRVAFGAPARPVSKHLGEAESYYVLENFEEYATSAWITDDVSAYDLAERRGIDVMDTRDTLSELVARGLASPREAFTAMTRMKELKRFPRNMPNAVSDFEQ